MTGARRRTWCPEGDEVEILKKGTAAIWKTLLIAEQTFRRLDAPELLAEVAEGVTYGNGVRVKPNPATAEPQAAA